MTEEQIRNAVLEALGEVAPESDLTVIRAEESFRDQLDIDSMDFLNLVIGLRGKLNVEVPEADYPKLATLDNCVRYLKRMSDGQGSTRIGVPEGRGRREVAAREKE